MAAASSTQAELPKTTQKVSREARGSHTATAPFGPSAFPGCYLLLPSRSAPGMTSSAARQKTQRRVKVPPGTDGTRPGAGAESHPGQS